MKKEKNVGSMILMVVLFASLLYIGVNDFKGTRAYQTDYCVDTREPLAGAYCCPEGYLEHIESNSCVNGNHYVDPGETCYIEEENGYVINSTCDWIEETQYLLFDKSLKVDYSKSVIGNLSVDTNVSSFLELIDSSIDISNTVYDKNDNLMNQNDKLFTGATFRVDINDESNIYYISINGDLDGDGNISNNDLTMIAKHILGVEKLNGAYLEAADYDKNQKVDINDIIKMEKVKKNNPYDSIYTVENSYTNSVNGVKYLLYNQADPKWGNLKFSDGGTMAGAGCHVTSVAVVTSSYDHTITPETVFRKIDTLRIDELVNSIVGPAITCENVDEDDIEGIISALSEGKIAVTKVYGEKLYGTNPFATSQHYMVLLEHKDNKIFVGNSYEREGDSYSSSGWYDKDIVLSSLQAATICTPSQEVIDKFK